MVVEQWPPYVVNREGPLAPREEKIGEDSVAEYLQRSLVRWG